MSECHVLCVMLERILRTCPDGAVFHLFLQVTGDSGTVSSNHKVTTFAFNVNLTAG